MLLSTSFNRAVDGLAPKDDSVSASWWRINISKTDDTGDFKAFISELEFRATVGGADQATGGTASASTSFASSGDFSPDAAFDDDDATGWSPDTGAALPQWLAYNFSSAVSVAQIAITAGDTATRADRAPEDFTIEYSDDGMSWTVAETYTGEPDWSAGETRTFAVSA